MSMISCMKNLFWLGKLCKKVIYSQLLTVVIKVIVGQKCKNNIALVFCID